MPFNGSGTYTPPGPPTFPAVPNTTIESDDFNQVILDIAQALTKCLTRDGQGRPTGPINWNGQNLTNVANFAATAVLINGLAPFTTANDGPGSGLDADTLDGSHAADFVLQTAYTAADILAKILTVDGAGSGLDADKLDGAEGSAYGLLASADFTVLKRGGQDVGYLGLPQNAQNSNYTIVLADQGKHIYLTGSGTVLTIPTNATTAFPVGTAICLVNDSSGTWTITRSGGVALKLAGTGADANHPLIQGGMATLVKVATDTWFVSGAGVS